MSDELIATHKIVVIFREHCPLCITVKSLIEKYTTIYEKVLYTDDIAEWVLTKTGRNTIPAVFVNGEYIGGCNEGGISKLENDGILEKMLQL